MAKKKETSEEVTEAGFETKGFEEASEAQAPTGGDDFVDEAVSMSEGVPVRLVAVLGQKNMVLKDLLKLKVGQALDLERPPNEFVDLVANGKLVARGELVEIDGKLGVRVIKMIK